MVEALYRSQASGVTRQALVKVWLANCLARSPVAKAHKEGANLILYFKS